MSETLRHQQTSEEAAKRRAEVGYVAAGGCGTEFYKQFLGMSDFEVEAAIRKMKEELAGLTPEEKARGEQILEEFRKTPIR